MKRRKIKNNHTDSQQTTTANDTTIKNRIILDISSANIGYARPICSVSPHRIQYNERHNWEKECFKNQLVKYHFTQMIDST